MGNVDEANGELLKGLKEVIKKAESSSGKALSKAKTHPAKKRKKLKKGGDVEKEDSDGSLAD